VDEAIIGRERELGAIRRLLDRSRGSSGALVIDGEAGIGKTTLWAETVRTAQRDGVRVLQSRPAESEASFSYAAVADLVGSSFEEIATELPPAQRRALAAALLLTETSERFNARTTSAALAGVFAALAERGALLVAIDDVQWLDAASEQALAFAARRLPDGLVLVVARRTDHDDDPPLGLGRALPEDRLERVALAPLSLAALHHVIRERLGLSLSRPKLVRLADASGGNPFFALEIARAVARDAPDGSPDGPLPVPRSVEELIAARVAVVSDAAHRVALAVAALSQPTLTTVQHALGDEVDASAALVEAEESGLLTTERDRIRFTHPLLASVVYRSASPERRRRLHERLASVVADEEERARHLALSVTTPREPVAAELERAAAGAARRGAHAAAAELFGASHRLTPAERGEALTRRALGEASALLAAGDVDAARTRAEPEADSQFPSLRGAALHLLGEAAWISGSGGPPSGYFEAALAAAPGDHELAARVYPKLISASTHEPKRAVAHAEAAMDLLRPERDAAALAQIAFDRFWAEIALGQGPHWDLFERWRRLEAKAGPDAPKTPLPLIYYWSVDDFDRARERYAVEEEWYRERGEDLWRAERLAHVSMAELRAGRWDIAQSGIEEACDALAQLFDKPGPWGAAFRIRALVDAHAGRTERARQTILPFIAKAELAKLALWEVLGLSTLAFIDFADGDHRAVDATLTRMRERMDSVDVKELAPDRSETFHIESLVALGDVEAARAALARLEKRGRSFPRLWITATLPRARALVLAASGDVPGALDALAELDVSVAEKLPFELAWTRLVQGRLHRRARHRRAAADTLAEALALFERLGAPTWAQQTRAELDRVGLRRAPDELTATERRVAELAASGLTNREIAGAAFMSPKTVEGNLAKVYRKLGIASRAELGAHMAEQSRRVDARP
jgi:DNA-binding CsgD family transcriptional regulator